jgi:hypothetical protein
MTRLKIVSAAALLSAAIATPVMAQEAIPGPGSRYGLEPQPGPTYYQNYDEPYGDGPVITTPRYYRGDGFFYGYRDHSRVGGRSSSLTPPAN